MITIKSLFSHPRKRVVYAVTGGKYLGELLVYVSSQEDKLNFLVLPHMKNRTVPKNKFDFGIKEKIIDTHVGKLPRYVYKLCKRQYQKNVEDNNIME